MLVVVEEVQKYDFFSSSPKFPQTEICLWWWKRSKNVILFSSSPKLPQTEICWWLGVSGELVGLIGGDLAEGAVCFPSMRMT